MDPQISYDKLRSTRDYLQNIAKVIGKIQQLFLEPNPHEWQKGLIIKNNKLTSQPFRLAGKTLTIDLNIIDGLVLAEDECWDIKKISAEDLRTNLEAWLRQHQQSSAIAKPDYGSQGKFDSSQARLLKELLVRSNQILIDFKGSLKGKEASPVLLFPHHFDTSLTLFPPSEIDKDVSAKQLNFGFSVGDEVVAEPYFYVTAYPMPKKFTALELPHGAYWQKDGFSGAVITYSNALDAADPDGRVKDFFNRVFVHGVKLL